MPFQFRKEAIEEDLNSNFPSQGQGNPPLYYSLSEVVVPTYSINSVTEGTTLPFELREALSHTNSNHIALRNSFVNTNLITNTGYWLIEGAYQYINTTGGSLFQLQITDGVTNKDILTAVGDGSGSQMSLFNFRYVVKLESGDTLLYAHGSGTTDRTFMATWRQLATVDGTLITP
jgi:hypothetical protein